MNKTIFTFLALFTLTTGDCAPRADANIFFIGHSLVNQDMPEMVHDLAVDAGLLNQYDTQIINGAPLRWNWQHSDEGQGLDSRVALPTGQYDVMVMTEGTPADQDMIEFGGNFFDLAQTSLPTAQTYYYETWHWVTWGEGDESAINWFNATEPNPAYHIPTPETNYDWRNMIDIASPMWVERVTAINQNYPQHKPMLIIPAGTALARLYDEVQSGLVPGMPDFSVMFEDNIHLTDIGNYFVALVQFSTIYGISPVGLTNQTIGIHGNVFSAPTPAQAAYFQQLVWEVVREYPHSGVSEDSSIFYTGFEDS